MIKGMELRESSAEEKAAMDKSSHLVKRVLKEQRGKDRRIESRRDNPLFFSEIRMGNFCIEIAKDSLLCPSSFMQLAKKLSCKGWADSIIKAKLVNVAKEWNV